MNRLFFSCSLLLLLTSLAFSQDKSLLKGTWEDVLSNNETSFQLVFKNDSNFIFASVPQANLMDEIAVTRDKIYQFKWITSNILAYSKLPDLDPMRAAAMPPVYALMRIDALNQDELIVTRSDDFTKSELDSIIDTGNFDPILEERTIQFRKLDISKSINEAALMGLWQSPESNDSTKFQLYIQKNKLGFLKVKKEAFKQPTALKPNKGYYYKWINANTLYYFKEKATGFVKADNNPNKYALMRIDEVNRKQLSLTISTRKFNRAGLDYVIENGNFDEFFRDNRHSYKRTKVVKKKA